MPSANFAERLLHLCEIKQKEPMKNHTTFRIGGEADFLALPQTTEEIKNVFALCREEGVPVFVMGNGSNLLASDEGFRGVVIKIAKKMSAIKVDGDMLAVQAGALMSAVGNAAKDAGLTGFEFASGIPGTIGGGVKMNAGAYGGEMADVVVKTEYITPQGEMLTCENHEFSYRHSFYSDKNYVILRVWLKLSAGDKAAIAEKMNDLALRRKQKQPLELPSAGSTFRRPEGHFAGTLIEQAGLKGAKIGGAEVSRKHAGFVVNTGGATAADVLALIAHIQKTVYDKFGVSLSPEVLYLK